jgi:hypothetical protein
VTITIYAAMPWADKKKTKTVSVIGRFAFLMGSALTISLDRCTTS